MTYDEAVRELRSLVTAEGPLLDTWQAVTREHHPGIGWLQGAVGEEDAYDVVPIPPVLKERALELAAQLSDKDAGRLLEWFIGYLISLSR